MIFFMCSPTNLPVDFPERLLKISCGSILHMKKTWELHLEHDPLKQVEEHKQLNNNYTTWCICCVYIELYNAQQLANI
jgi:hypothetical protein